MNVINVSKLAVYTHAHALKVAAKKTQGQHKQTHTALTSFQIPNMLEKVFSNLLPFWWYRSEPNVSIKFLKRLEMYTDSQVCMEMRITVKAVNTRLISLLPCRLGTRLVLVILIGLNVCACFYSILNSVHTVSMRGPERNHCIASLQWREITPLDTLQESNCSMIHTWFSMLGSALAFSRASIISECPFLHA